MEKQLTNADLRALRIIEGAIKKLNLNLSGQIILTEAGSGFYRFTPIIALMAGAEKVIAYTGDSAYGLASEIRKSTYNLASHLNINDKLTIRQNKLTENDFEIATIITNSGYLRPLDKSKLNNVNTKCVIPLMFEAWEIRDEDIDIEYCRESKIKVAGTWENHPLINVFSGIRVLAVKLALEAGYEIISNKIAVWSDDHFGEEAVAGFKAMGAQDVFMTTDYSELQDRLVDIDFVFVCDYSETRPYFGREGIWEKTDFENGTSPAGIVKLYGDFPANFPTIYPLRYTVPKQMSATLGHLGPKLIIDLQVAGFRVAQHMLENTKSRLVQPITY